MSPFIVAVAALAIVVSLRIVDPGVVAALRNQTFDFYQRLTPRPSKGLQVRVIGIDERSLERFGQWPWPRKRLAELSDTLVDLGAATIAYSILFAEPDRTSPARALEQILQDNATRAQALKISPAGLSDYDEIFASALRRSPSVLGFASTARENPGRPHIRAGVAIMGPDPATLLPRFRGAKLPIPILETAARGIGGLGLDVGSGSGIVRRIPAIFSDGRILYPSIAIEALRIAQGAPSILVRSGSISQTPAASTLTGLRVGQFVVPLTQDGEVWLYFDHDRPERYISAADILDPSRQEAVRDMIQGHVVFVGATAPGLADHLVTPLGEVVPGVSVQAQLAEQVLAGTFLTRPDWASGAELIATVILGLLVVLLLVLLGARFSFVSGGVIAALTIATSWLAFSQTGYLIDPVYPSLGALAVYLAVTGTMHVTTDRERRFVRQAFRQYLSPQLLTELEKAPDRMQLGGEVRLLTIMFMDVRDFTPISETLPATDLVHFLNTLLSPLSDVIHFEGGTIDKYIGDSIMAFWNAPLDIPNHAERACRAALQMQAALQDLNVRDAFGFRSAGHPNHNVRIGIGINTGLACVGNMGSKSRFNYSAVGDAVNIAARIEAYSKEYGADILISQETARAIPGFAHLEIGAVQLKGKAKPTKLFALVGDEAMADTPQYREIVQLHEDLLQALADRDGPRAEALVETGCQVADPRLQSLFGKLRKTAREVAGPNSCKAGVQQPALGHGVETPSR